MEQTAGPLPTDDVSHVVNLGEEAAPLFPLAEHCELPSISADVGGVNLRDPSAIEEFYSRNIDVGKQIAIVFHCEFSSSRAPKLFKHMRNLDRLAHMETYPELAFPNMFLLKGGYKAFFELYSELCVPQEYVKMSDPKFVDHLRVSSSSLKRSWNQRSKDFIDSHCGDRDEPLIDVSNVQQKEKPLLNLIQSTWIQEPGQWTVSPVSLLPTRSYVAGS
ncbi:unnamed protein product [Sphagnum tenellum]